MSGGVAFTRNTATVPQIAAHLRDCDLGFVPPLGERVVIDDYARKIAAHAERFEAWADGGLIGLVAAYCTDLERRLAFMTNVSVVPDWQGKGLASRLVGGCLDHVRELGFQRMELQVDRRNRSALALYGKFGFAAATADGPVLTMAVQME